MAAERWEPLIGYLGGAGAAILLANISLVVVYLVFDLTLFQLVIVYWCECVWIGVFSALKLIVASLLGSPYDTRNVGVSRGASLLLSVIAILFFGGKYLGFLMLLGLLVIGVPMQLGGLDAWELANDGMAAIVLSSAVLFLGHGLSFVINFLIRGEYRAARALRLLFWPYVRCGALLLGLGIATGVLLANPVLASAQLFAVVLMIVKLFMDSALHVRERRNARIAPN